MPPIGKPRKRAGTQVEETPATKALRAEIQQAVSSAVKDAIPMIIDHVNQAKENTSNLTDLSSGEIDNIQAQTPQIAQVQVRTFPEGASTQATAGNDVTQNIVDHIRELSGESGNAQVSSNWQNHFDQGVPVDHHVTPAKRLAILSHQYVDFNTLIKKDNETLKSFSLKLHNDDMVVVQNESGTLENTSKSIGLWESQFLIYATVLCRKEPEQAVGLFHYLNHIRSMNRSGYDWYKYDQSFRRLHADNPLAYPFSRDVISLQMQCLHNPSQNRQNQMRNNAAAAKTKSTYGQWGYKSNYNNNYNHGDKGNNNTPFPKGTCWVYQRGMSCNGRCDWPTTHFCCYCKGDHPAVACPGGKSESENQHTTDHRRDNSSAKVNQSSNKTKAGKGAQ